MARAGHDADRRDQGLRDALNGAGQDIAIAVENRSREALDRVFDSPVTYWGGLLSRWMAEPAGEAVRYAVQKNVIDPSLTDGDLMRREALQWSKAWLREHGRPIPPDSQLGLMIEAAVLEAKRSTVG